MTFIQTGRRGRPKIVIDEDWLREAVTPDKSYSLKTIARLCGVSSKTVRAQCRHYGIEFGYAEMTQYQMDALCRVHKERKPGSGYRYILGWLRGEGLRVTKDSVLESLRRVDAVGQAIRRYGVVDRRPYSVPHSNYLWHIDGHHKLINWGIVVHGIVDGYCRTVSLEQTY